MNGMRLPKIIVLGFMLAGACPSLFAEPVELQYWNGKSGSKEFALYLNCTSGTPFRYDRKNPFIREINMVKNAGGFVTIQASIANPAPWRKTFRVRWQWGSASGMASTSPNDSALEMVTLAGNDLISIRGVSSIPNPTCATLTLFPAK